MSERLDEEQGQGEEQGDRPDHGQGEQGTSRAQGVLPGVQDYLGEKVREVTALGGRRTQRSPRLWAG